MAVEGVAPNMMQFGPAIIVPNNSGDGFPRMTPAIIPTVVPTTIVREVLTESNYENWSTCVKWYLVGQDLWEVCQTKDNIPDEAKDPEAFSVWEKKNAMALHAIHISCSGEMLSEIRKENCASYVWDFLQKRAKPTFCFDPKVSGIDERSPAASASTGKLPSLFLSLKIIISLYIINLDIMYTNAMLREKTSGKIGWGLRALADEVRCRCHEHFPNRFLFFKHYISFIYTYSLVKKKILITYVWIPYFGSCISHLMTSSIFIRKIIY